MSGNNEEHEKLVYALMSEKKLAVIATCANGRDSPECALVAHCEDKDLCIYFQSKRGTRKVENIKINPRVSFVIGLNMELITMQYSGRADAITDQDSLEKCKMLFVNKESPTTLEYFNSETIFYKVSPTWIGYSDYRDARQPRVFELNFKDKT